MFRHCSSAVCHCFALRAGYYLLKSQQWKHQDNVKDPFKDFDDCSKIVFIVNFEQAGWAVYLRWRCYQNHLFNLMQNKIRFVKGLDALTVRVLLLVF